jgi:hypothetical protein
MPAAIYNPLPNGRVTMRTSTQPDQKKDGLDALVATLNARHERLARAEEAAHDYHPLLNVSPQIERRHSLPPYNQTYKQRE